jgi:hypothetical protein
MLECDGLMFRPWVPTGAPNPHPQGGRGIRGQERTILDPATGTVLGFARWRRGTGAGLLRWFSRPVLQVYETEDASLLCTAHVCWGWPRRWQVRDAEGNPVGTFRRGQFRVPTQLDSLPERGAGRRLAGTLVQDRFGQPLGCIEATPRGVFGSLLTPDGRELGTVTRTALGTEVQFDASLQDRPFTKMVLLAALLGSAA